jgi:hypothetical protein
MTLHLERIQGEFAILRVRLNNVDYKLERLADELTPPSGKVTQQFASLEERIKHLGDEPKPQG